MNRVFFKRYINFKLFLRKALIQLIVELLYHFEGVLDHVLVLKVDFLVAKELEPPLEEDPLVLVEQFLGVLLNLNH